MQNRRFFSRLFGVAVTTFLLAGLASCSKQQPPAPAASAPASATANAKEYVVGTDAAYAPFESQAANGDIVGFDIDVLKAAAEKGGFKVKFVNTPWEGIFNSLAQGDRDILISSVTITNTRKQTMDFSAPYFDSRLQIAIGKDSKVTRLADLKTLKVGVQTGTTGDEAVTKLQGKTSALIKRFESTPMALDELKAHGVDAVVGDNGVVEHYVANNGAEQLKIVEDSSFAPEQFGIVVKKGNTELLEKINQGLAAIKADGTYDKIYAKYFKPAAKQ